MKADYYMGDLYPNLAYFNTRSETIPEPADQSTLVDHQETAVKNPMDVSPKTSKNIFATIGVIFLIIVLLGIRF